MAQAAVPLLVGTGVQILGAEMGWDPRLTAIASMAAGGVGAGMASGAFAGGTAAQAATGVASSVNPHAGLLSNAFTPQAGSAVAGGLGATDLMGGQGAMASNSVPYKSINPHANFHSPQAPPTWRTPAVDAVKAPFFDRTQYETVTEKGADGKLVRTRRPVYGEDGKVMKGMSSADALGVSMLDTFLQYELQLANQPPERIRIPSSGGGGGGGGGASGPAFQGGSGGKKYQVVDFYGTGGTPSYQPQPI